MMEIYVSESLDLQIDTINHQIIFLMERFSIVYIKLANFKICYILSTSQFLSKHYSPGLLFDLVCGKN
jgi:hypothetical protein